MIFQVRYGMIPAMFVPSRNWSAFDRAVAASANLYYAEQLTYAGNAIKASRFHGQAQGLLTRGKEELERDRLHIIHHEIPEDCWKQAEYNVRNANWANDSSAPGG